MAQGNTAYKNDPAWISWLALVNAETKALSDHFSHASIKELDDALKEHRHKFDDVDEYRGSLKPKHMLRANYPVDIYYVGPLIRSWCMTFEAMLQILKLIAHSSNFKNVNERLARIMAIRQGLNLYNSKLTDWNDMKLTYSKWAVAVTYQADSGRFEIAENKYVDVLDAFCHSVRSLIQHAHVTHAPGACNARVWRM